MKLNYYIIASLPELHWEGDIKGTLADFLDANEFIFEPYRPVINDIVLYNEIRNLELLLRQRTEEEHEYTPSFVPGLIPEDEMVKFLEMPFINQPDEYPDYIAEYLVDKREDMERLASMEELYQEYYRRMKESHDSFTSFYAQTVYMVRTVAMAIRLQRMDAPLEEHLVGDEEVVEVILDHRNSTDFGLKGIFPEIGELQALFEKPVLDLEKELDLFILDLLYRYREEDLFGDHVIYLYILSLFFRDRWVLLNEERGKRVVEEILQG